MVTLEQVDKLCERADISYDEARAVLEETNGDILEAIILLEKQGRMRAPKGGGYYNSSTAQQTTQSEDGDGKCAEKCKDYNGTTFSQLMGSFFRWCGKVIHIGNINTFEVMKNGNKVVMIPVTALVLLLIFAFWITVPILIIGLFFGYRYLFHGPDLEKTKVNNTMDTVADAAEKLKKEVKDHKGE